MHIRRTRFCCLTAGSLLWLASGLVVYWACFPESITKDQPGMAAATRQLPAEANDHSRGPTDPPLSAFEPLWDQPLRRPLFDPPPVIPDPPPKKELPPLRVKLLATMIEATGDTAMFSTANGTTVFRQAGQAVDDSQPPAEILEIHPNRVLLRYAEQDVTLTIAGASEG